ncbi:hypothetical protein GLOIN_2v1739675 [Rhizophagus irregularis DAOM 181602=DAOM 197198]|uniref:Uncharacterized protein n=1 Tax=Rhizophagus irregularis (strain DAOM 181602 / DAOM 197198 / MUCL 43194) TaxID=747089 RepID=A0A2P4NPY7_RHIID|nr:hypothetical protein GLOIN_2v1739675 [Rhizophagus irregularis DAOM 181602=DAOM 197198]POG55202.1 hypothetical protein GLOIN_2v1739675 [Rhizophagus irregularis DAOM 181602=DAOM 197198]|eukprot:XP_025164290.1 hypothetical protein GLOIN_2v1739675 [Rhizophagus irregularis DAOM 181602=DAOM 197198]
MRFNCRQNFKLMFQFFKWLIFWPVNGVLVPPGLVLNEKYIINSTLSINVFKI